MNKETVDVVETVKIRIEEGEKRGMSLADTLQTFRENAGFVTEKVWKLMGGCPCCPSYPEHQKLCSLIIEALEEKGKQ
jgi:hypothetical protein